MDLGNRRLCQDRCQTCGSFIIRHPAQSEHYQGRSGSLRAPRVMPSRSMWAETPVKPQETCSEMLNSAGFPANHASLLVGLYNPTRRLMRVRATNEVVNPAPPKKAIAAAIVCQVSYKISCIYSYRGRR